MSKPPASLREYDRLEDRLRQHRQVSDAPIVIVEGPDDLVTLRPHLQGLDIFPGDGKNNVVSCCRALRKWGIDRYVGVVDRDFDWHEHEDIADLCHTYSHRDLEAMLISLGVLTLVLEHQGSTDKLAAVGGASELVNRLVALVEPVTRLRAANAREGLGIAFDQVDLGGKIDQKSLTLKLQSYCAALAGTCDELDAKTLIAAAEMPADDEFGPRGKDVLAAAGIALRRLAGSLQQQATTEPVLAGQLRSSCGLALSKSPWLEELRRRAGSVSA